MTPALELLVVRAATWLAPIPGAAPAGASAAYDPEYQAVRAEIEKLETPTGGAVDWKEVSRRAGELLRTRTKDLLLASILARALHVTAGPAGLATGAALLAGMLDQYWESMEPGVKRARARANALSWFIEKTVLALAGDLPVLPAAEVEELEGALATLAEVARARLGEATPAFGPLVASLERLKLAAMPAAAAPGGGGGSAGPGPDPVGSAAAPPPTVPASAAATRVPDGLAAATAGLASPEPTPVLGSRQEVTDFLVRVGAALIEAARALRQAASDDASSYRVLRAGLWLHLDAPPPSEGGRTAIAPPPEPLRTKLALLSQNQQWMVLLDEAESALPRQRLALDLQHASWQALDGLGPSHRRARDAVAAGLRDLLLRMPRLATLAFSDGSPLASPRTRAWIDDEVSPRGATTASSTATAGAVQPAPLAQLKELLQGTDAAGALARAQEMVLGGAGGRERFLRRLELARACAGAGLTALARALYEELSREAGANGLDTWEPRLAAEALKGLLVAARSLADDPRGAPQQLGEHYRRLCALDPAGAHQVWP